MPVLLDSKLILLPQAAKYPAGSSFFQDGSLFSADHTFTSEKPKDQKHLSSPDNDDLTAQGLSRPDLSEESIIAGTLSNLDLDDEYVRLPTPPLGSPLPTPETSFAGSFQAPPFYPPPSYYSHAQAGSPQPFHGFEASQFGSFPANLSAAWLAPQSRFIPESADHQAFLPLGVQPFAYGTGLGTPPFASHLSEQQQSEVGGHSPMWNMQPHSHMSIAQPLATMQTTDDHFAHQAHAHAQAQPQGQVSGTLQNQQQHQHSKYRFGAHDGINVHRKMYHRQSSSGAKRSNDDGARYAHAKLTDFTGSIFSMCKDQHGCRFLQRQLDEDGSKGIAATLVFNEVYLKVVELMTDPFGNYLVQKLFERVLQSQRTILVTNAQPHLGQIALDPHGTRALQKLIECIDTTEEAQAIVKALTPDVVILSRDLNGNHVVQKCLQNLTSEHNQFVFDATESHCLQVATHRHGCCVLQRCLDYGSTEQRAQLLRVVAQYALQLALDPFGNYVVQYVFSRGDAELVLRISLHVSENVVTLLMHKYGLNVIEKCLTNPELAPGIAAALMANRDLFGEMLNDAYGNYVLQTCLDVAEGQMLNTLSRALEPLLPLIKNTPHARRILGKIQSVQEKYRDRK